MRNKSAEKVKLSSFDDLFGKEEPVSGALAKGFDGYLRWAYDYWTQSDPTSAQDGSNARSRCLPMISASGAAAISASFIRTTCSTMESTLGTE